MGQRIDHVDRAAMVRDHEIKKLAVEIDALGGGQCRHLRRRRHALHHRPRMIHRTAGHHHRHMVRRGHYQRRTALGQPAAHELHLVLLRCQDPCRDGQQLRMIGPRRCERRHRHRLVVMDDHHLHEVDVGADEAGIGDPRRLGRGDDLDRRADRPRLDDADLRHRGGGKGDDDGQQKSALGHDVPR